MTAAELTFEILDRRKITVKEKDYWCCFEVNEKEEMGESQKTGHMSSHTRYSVAHRCVCVCVCVCVSERPLHYQEKVLPIFHSLGTDSHLLVKKYFSMEAMLVYLGKRDNKLVRNQIFECKI